MEVMLTAGHFSSLLLEEEEEKREEGAEDGIDEAAFLLLFFGGYKIGDKGKKRWGRDMLKRGMRGEREGEKG